VQPQAELINFDYRGFQFNNIWLVGDAAGLASGLTGEGIHPAIVSGEAVARRIIDPAYPADEINQVDRQAKKHQKIVDLSGGNTTLCTLLMETLVFMLRLRIINFQKQLSM
jgi:flavin-dependent dehydrogenase